MALAIDHREEIEVYAGNRGHICIKQKSYNDEYMTIIVHPDDIPSLIYHLNQECKEALAIREAIKLEPQEKQ